MPFIKLILRIVGVIFGGLFIWLLFILVLDISDYWGQGWVFWVFWIIVFIAGYLIWQRWQKRKSGFSILARRLGLVVTEINDLEKDNLVRDEITAFATHFSRPSNIALNFFASGKIQDRIVRVFSLSIWLGSYHTFTCVQVKMERSFLAWAMLLPRSPGLQKLSIEAELESNDFNRQTRLYSTSRQDAFRIFSPDLMQWYLDQQYRPWVFLEADRCTLIHQGMVTNEIPTLIEWFGGLYSKMIRSGALEPVKKAEPLFPRLT